MNTERYIIENSFIKKELVIEKGRITSFSYTNKVSDSDLTADTGSEVFVLSFGGGFFKNKIKLECSIYYLSTYLSITYHVMCAYT